ncbi:MAG TPA: cupin domain-containing protein [Candidatus Sulfotelmatobacter sp.]|nr:cupin domain-containing protein [Candidatus Sulfotelmatobacter sp.]
MPDTAMAPKAKTKGRKKAHTTPESAKMVPGRRDFFTYADLGVTDASKGHMRAQVTTAKRGMTQPTGWHYHVCESQFVYALRGWVDLAFEDGSTVRVKAGESIYIPGGLKHNEIATSDDFQILEVSVPAEMGTETCEPPAGFKK